MSNEELLDAMQEQYERLLKTLHSTADEYVGKTHHESPVMTTLVDLILHQAFPVEMKAQVDRHVLAKLGVDSLDKVTVTQYNDTASKVLDAHGTEMSEAAWNFLIITIFLAGQKFRETILECNCLEDDTIHNLVEDWRREYDNEGKGEAGRDAGGSSSDTDSSDG